MRTASLASCLLVALLPLAACTSYGPGQLAEGASEQQVVAAMGQPTSRFPRPEGGQRLEFRRGPAGLETFMLDFDASGRLTHREQVLDAQHFDRLRVGMDRGQVLQEIGHPGYVQSLRYQQRELWSYRYQAPICQLFQVSFGADGHAVEVGYGRDPACDPDTL